MKTPKVLLLAAALVLPSSKSSAAPVAEPAVLTARQIHYQGSLSDEQARFTVSLEIESTGKGECSLPLFEGDVAVVPVRLGSSLTLVREGNQYRLVASRPGVSKIELQVVARIQRVEPWNQIVFTGPAAAIGSVTAQAAAGTDIQLQNGTTLEAAQTNGLFRVQGFLGADPRVALRWSKTGGVTAVQRRALFTVDTAVEARITSAVIKYTSHFHYEMIQGSAAQLTLEVPARQTLTRLAGEQIRDWHAAMEGDRQILTIEFIKPLEKSYDLTVCSEQTVDGASSEPARVLLNPPQPLQAERESGSLAILAEDTQVECSALSGLRQINAPGGALAAYRFNGRPFALSARLKRLEPEVQTADQVNVRVEESRVLISHLLGLDVRKAGIYSVDLLPQDGLVVTDVHGDGVEDWKMTRAPGGSAVLHVTFSSRLLGKRDLRVQLEQALKAFPEHVTVNPLRMLAATRETAVIGASAAPGIRLRTASMSGARETPVQRLANRGDAALAYTAEQAKWDLSLGCEPLASRIVADVFNLITIGDGMVGGSAIIRYGVVNQGVQEFRVSLPAGCRNVEFTGPNIRRKEAASPGSGGGNTNDVVWTLGLQDKVWGGYTLVVTYDFPFDPKGTTLALGGAHAVGAERETGSIAITTAASLELSAHDLSDGLRRVDEGDLAAVDRAMSTRPAVLAYRYTGDRFHLALDVKRYDADRVLEAVADRTQLTSVLTDSGEMLTQASFMVKNNEKQFQGFRLPAGATLWSCYVNGKPAKPEWGGEQVLVPLPREANRDQAFAVDIVYAQTNKALTSLWSRPLDLAAPQTDVPNTYAEWQLFVPASFRLSAFGGSMNVARGTTYQWLDAWQKFLAFYLQVLKEAGSAIAIFGVLAAITIALVISAVRRGWSGVMTLAALVGILAVLCAMLLPALSSAKSKANRISSVNNLKQIGLAARLFAQDNQDRLPQSLDEMKDQLNNDSITYDLESGRRYVYVGAGRSIANLNPNSVLAYGPVVDDHCNVLLADGSVSTLNAAQFEEAMRNGLVKMPSDTTQALPATGLSGIVMSTPVELNAVSDHPVVTGLPAAPRVSGIRSLRIELPQVGRSFLFTKVLNVRDEPLSISMRIMPQRTFDLLQMSWQAGAFLLGLAVAVWQWRRPSCSSFILSAALALVLGSLASLLIQWRALHEALIIGFPVAGLAILAGLIWKYWPRGSAPQAADPEPALPAQPGPGLPPVTAALLIFLGLSVHHAAAETSLTNVEPAVSVISASYQGSVNDRVAVLDAQLQLSPTAPGQCISLFNDEVVVQSFKVRKGEARLIRDGHRIAVRLEGRNMVTLEIRLLVKVAGDVTRRSLRFDIPPALSSRASIVVDQQEADVDFPTAISFQRSLEKEKTRVDAIIGAADRLELLWTPRVKRADEVAATVFCQNSALVTFGGGVVNIHSAFDYQITQGELRQARVRVPADQRVLRVEGASIRTWEIRNDSDGPVLVVELLKGMPQQWQLTIETEKALDTLPLTAAVAVPRALDVKRETGLLALRSTEEVGLGVDSASDLQRVDVEEFTRAGLEATGPLMSAFRFTRPEFALRVRAAAIEPEIDATVQNQVRIGREQISLSSTIDYRIRKVGVFSLAVELPQGYRLDAVTGTNILQTTERPSADGGSILEITLKERTAGAYQLHLEIARNLDALPNSLPLAGVWPMKMAKLTGYIAVAPEPGVALKTGALEGLTEIPATALPESGAPELSARREETGGVLAYRFIDDEPKAAPAWRLSVATEIMEAWVRAEIVSTIMLSEAVAEGKALVRYEIGNAPVKELRLKIPAAFQNVEIAGAGIRSREQNGEIWSVQLQSQTRGFCVLTVTWEQPRATGSSAAELTSVEAEGVERETGWLAVVARAPLQVSEATATELQRSDPAEFPDWAGMPDPTTVLAYHYVQPGHRLAVDVRRFDAAAVLQALVDQAQFTTVVAEDGQTMTEMSLTLHNRGKQYLEVQLPAGATNWSAFVAGQPVRPSRRQGWLLLPIAPAGAEDGPISVQLTYVGSHAFPHRRGAAEFETPRFDIPLKNARWELFLPPDYSYGDFGGTMVREAAMPQTTALSFSGLDYSRMEEASKNSWKADLQRDVHQAEDNLSGGNMREAVASFSRAKASAGYSGEDTLGVKELEKKLKSAQASNLILAQNEFSVRNSAVAASAGYDSAAAEQQWVKLQQAQELAVSKVQPLRVNLPLRGLRYAFTQVLQTEVARPMTVRLFAANTRAVSWPQRLTFAAGAFLALWATVALALRSLRRTETARIVA